MELVEAATALSMRFTVAVDRAAAALSSTITFAAGRRSHPVNSPSSSTVTCCHNSSRCSKNHQKCFRSEA
jgi:hypothetical protein